MKVAREMAGIISAGCITYTAVANKLRGKAESHIVHRCMRSVTERYRVLREEVRIHNKSLADFSNGLLEGTVNKAKAIKRGMYNRANADVLRAKMIYADLKWDWNYHLN